MGIGSFRLQNEGNKNKDLRKYEFFCRNLLPPEEESINILAMTVANVLPSGGAGIAAPAQFNVPTLRFSRALVRSPHRLLGTKERTVDAKIAMVTPKPSFMMKLSCLLMLEILYEKKDGFLVLSIR